MESTKSALRREDLAIEKAPCAARVSCVCRIDSTSTWCSTRRFATGSKYMVAIIEIWGVRATNETRSTHIYKVSLRGKKLPFSASIRLVNRTAGANASGLASRQYWDQIPVPVFLLIFVLTIVILALTLITLIFT